jgi:betaine-aldehyde dehydrogenase
MPHGGSETARHGEENSMPGFEDYTRVKHVMSFIGS